LDGSLSGYDIQVVSCESKAGGGSLPGEVIPSMGIAISKQQLHVNEAEEAFRKVQIPLIVRIEENRLLLDMRTLMEEDIVPVCDILKEVLG